MLCNFLPNTPDKTDFDCAQTRILSKIPKNRKKKRKQNLSTPTIRKAETKNLHFLTEGTQKAFLGANEANPTVQKKLPAGVINFGLLWDFEIWYPIQQFQVPAPHSGLHFSYQKPADVTLWAWAAFSISKKDPEGSDLAKITRFWEEQPHSDMILTGLPECETFVNSLVPLFGVIQQYQAAQAPNITSNLQRTLLGYHNIPKSIEVERSINRSTVCLVRTIQLGCSNLLENNNFSPLSSLQSLEQFSARCDC